jgi:hypothetical protein
VSTRGFITFVIDGTEKTAYNHSDSYPDYLGVQVLKWLRGADIITVTEQARALRVADADSTPTTEDVQRLLPYANLGVGEQSPEDWYCLLRETQGDPGLMLEAGVIEDASSFPLDSLFAEWGYVIDLDAQRFEVYQGFQQSKPNAGRFADREGSTEGYYPVALVASYPFPDLPGEDAIRALERDGDECE